MIEQGHIVFSGYISKSGSMTDIKMECYDKEKLL